MTRFPTTPLENVRAYGAIPVFSWNSTVEPAEPRPARLQPRTMIDGRYDSYIREFATKAKEWGHPFFLRFDWEMNGFWFPWSEGVNGNTPGQFVAAWRHVHDIFTAVGATNATWVWCPNVDLNGGLIAAGRALPGRRLRRLDRPRRLQLGQAPRLAGLADLQPGLPPHLPAGSSTRSRRASR